MEVKIDAKRKHLEPKAVEMFEAKASRGRGGKGGMSSKPSSDISGMLCNINSGVSPFSYQNGAVDVRDAIVLCQKAYWNVASFRLTVDIMSEFANAPLHFVGKNKTAVKFFEAWYEKINGSNLGDQFFRELFRSSNVFLYRVESTEDAFKNRGIKIPIRYILLNPADMRCQSSSNFFDSTYLKILNDFEVAVLKNSTDPKNIELKKSLPEKVQRDIEKGVETSMPLTAAELIPVFFKKQDYEPLAVPMYFPVLFDINLKLEFKKAEQIIARACEYMVLLINLGDEENGVDERVRDAVEVLFRSESVGRVFIADWSTKMSYIIPDLEKILGPEKYTSVNQDIANGLMNIFFGEQRYADSVIKIRVFLERLKEARKVFLNEFLKPEMRAIADKMGFRECPEPVFERFDLKDEVEYMKLYNRLAELGFLTQEEVLHAYKTHNLPEHYDSIVSQEKFKEQKEQGLFAPVSSSVNGQAGRPTGDPQIQKQNKTVTPIGQGSTNYSCEKLKDVSQKATELINKTLNIYKDKFKISRASKKHKSMARNVAFSVMQNEFMSDWDAKLQDYIENPLTIGPAYNEVVSLAGNHSLDFNSAAILLNCRADDN